MSYKTILVHLDASKAAGARADIALALAQTFDAHVAALYALTVVPAPTWAFTAAGITLAEARVKAETALREGARAVWDAALRRSGWGKVEWRSSELDALEATSLHARYADLVVIGQNDPGDGSTGVAADFQQRLPLVAGRPVLVVPYAREKRPVGENVLVAWNASRESTRAVTDALPLLRKAKQVHVASFNPGRTYGTHGDVPGADIALYLSRHGVNVAVSQYQAADIDVGNDLLSRAADLDADLIVMGAYGHSRFAELMLGGVTRTLLESMTVPVILSH
jgi:nucleotide-binding universal stress UspA family protein